MARPLRIEYEGAVYHVTGRGNERRKIYFTPADYQKFIEYIKTTRDRYGIILHAYGQEEVCGVGLWYLKY